MQIHTGQRQSAQSRKNRKILTVLAIILAVFLGCGAVGVVALQTVAPGVFRSIFGAPDYQGDGEGEAQITIYSGDIGADIAHSLYSAGVTASVEIFVDYLVKEQPNAEFGVGTYRLKQKMSAAAAFRALQNPANRLDMTAVIPEGFVAQQAYERLSAATGIPVADFTAAAAAYVELGVPAEFPSIEGFLFPATYEFTPEDTAVTILQKMVDRTWQALAEHGVAAEAAFTVLTKAALIQKEAGQDVADYAKIARVFENRLARGMNLQSDATVAYGAGTVGTVWTTDKQRADTTNPYNTYAHAGLPAGPIGLPGDIAIAAALNPAEGDWLYFVAVNLETGETVFSNTAEEHAIAVQQLQEWCVTHEAAGGRHCD